MNEIDMISRRLNNQALINSRFENPRDVVEWFGAIQSQDFAAAKWAIGQRLTDATDEKIETAFNNGDILRTHVMRPTWHFVSPRDIRWLLALTSDRVKKFNGSYFKRSGYDRSIFNRTNKLIGKALQMNKQMTRQEIKIMLELEKVPLNNLGLSFVMMQAELESIICSGPRLNKQFTYMLLDQRAPKNNSIDLDKFLVRLIKRYFQSHGPAQIRDFVWWSGLTMTDARKGIELLGKTICSEKVDGKAYYFFDNQEQFHKSLSSVHLLPGFDEYFIAYTDRDGILDKKYAKHLNAGGGMISGAVIVNGRMIGVWKRMIEKKGLHISLKLYEKIDKYQKRLIDSEIIRFSEFLKLPILKRNVGF